MSIERNSQDKALVSGFDKSLPSFFSRNSPQNPPRKDPQVEPVPDVLTVENTGKEYDSKKIKALDKNFLSSSSSSRIQAKSKPQDRSVTPSKIQAGSSRSVPQGSPSSSGQPHQESVVKDRSKALEFRPPRTQGGHRQQALPVPPSSRTVGGATSHASLSAMHSTSGTGKPQIERQPEKRPAPDTRYSSSPPSPKRPTKPNPEPSKRRASAIPSTFKVTRKCALCPYQGPKDREATWDDISLHFNEVHKDGGEEKFGCPGCAKTFKRSEVVRPHQWTHTEGAEAKLVCDSCAKQFHTSRAYNLHTIMMVRKRPICIECLNKKGEEKVICSAAEAVKHYNTCHPESSHLVSEKKWGIFVKNTRDTQ